MESSHQRPVSSKPAGRLASGAVYCFKAIVARSGTWPLVFNLYGANSEIAAWDPNTLTFTFPLVANSCPAGMSASSVIGIAVSSLICLYALYALVRGERF